MHSHLECILNHLLCDTLSWGSDERDAPRHPLPWAWASLRSVFRPTHVSCVCEVLTKVVHTIYICFTVQFP